MEKLTQYQKRQMQLTDEQKEAEKEKRRIKDRERYAKNKEKHKYKTLKNMARKFIRDGNIEDIREIQKLIENRLNEHVGNNDKFID